MIKGAALRIASKGANGKQAKLFGLITSVSFGQKLESIDTIADQLSGFDAKERTQHEKTWKDRGKLITALKAASDAIAADIDEIIGDDDSE